MAAEWARGIALQGVRDEKTLPEINDKLLFARVMERSSVPTPPIIAVFDGGQQIAGLTGPASVGEVGRYVGLFVKPVRSSGGKDSLLWERQPNGTWVYRVSSRPGEGLQRAINSQDHRAFSSEEWLEWLLRLSASGGLLVQQRLTNHPQLSLLGVPELISLRILTGLGQAGVIVLRAVLYLPFRNSIHWQHGLKSAVRFDEQFLSIFDFWREKGRVGSRASEPESPGQGANHGSKPLTITADGGLGGPCRSVPRTRMGVKDVLSVGSACTN